MNPEIKEMLTETLNALERLLNIFRIERIIHLIIGAVAFLMLLYAIVLLISSKDVTSSLLVSLFGSSGLIAASSARITYFFNKAFGLIEEIIRSIIKSEKSHEK